MFYFVIFILDNPDQGPTVLEAWEKQGVTGITILESSAYRRENESAARDDLPLMPSLEDVFKVTEERNRTFFALVENQERVDGLLNVTESIVGTLGQDGTGQFIVLPVSHVYGKS